MDRGNTLLLKRLAIGGMATLLVVLTAVPVSAASFQPHGRAALLLDGTTGQILYQQNAQIKNYPASTTKLLTALVAVEHGKLTQSIKVSTNAVDMPPGSSMCYLQDGEEQKLEHLLYGLLLVSGNDCAQAIADGLSNGKPDQFVAWMNETAKRLGADNSHFTNPHGLHDPAHYTTALDLALIARGALQNPTVRKISGSTEFTWPGKSEINGVYYNHNQMLFRYAGAVGGKNGFTEEADLTLVTAAERDGRLLIGVVMGEPNQSSQYGDMTDLLDMGFGDFDRQTAVAAGTSFGDVTVTNGKGKSVTAVAQADFPVTAPKGGKAPVTLAPRLDASVAAPVTSGQKLGEVEIREGDRVLGTVPLVAEDAVAVRAFFSMGSAGAVAGTALGFVWTGVRWLLYLVIGLFAVRITVKGTRRIVRRYRRKGSGYQGAGGRGSISLYRVKGR